MYKIIVNPSCVAGLPITQEVGACKTHQEALKIAEELMAANKGVNFYQEKNSPNIWRASCGGWLRVEKTTTN